MNLVILNTSFSTSESLLKTPFAAATVNVTSSFVVLVSATKSGASFTELTVIFNLLLAVFVPSVMV